VTSDPAPAGIRAVLLDIEGTTTPIAFVVEKLFPYARRSLRRHLEQHQTSLEYRQLFDELRKERDADESAGAAVPSWIDGPPSTQLTSVAGYVEWLMDGDRKSTPLKTLQGRIWEEGYRRGELVGEVFADVPRALERWRAQGAQIGIFSSGSVLAQQLLFRHSSAGDLTRFLQWYFDTTIGRKADPESYRRIASTMSTPAHDILFISDVVRELDAARTSGMRTLLSMRPGNSPSRDHDYASVTSFDEVV
jgi:enolase-phosphatase E1